MMATRILYAAALLLAAATVVAGIELSLLSSAAVPDRDEDGVSEYFEAAEYRRHRRAMHGLAEDCSILPDKCQPHGNCMQDIGCVCYLDAVRGYWRDALCTSCAYGYAEEDCVVECEGGSCNPCSSNGVCNQGTTGDGTCTCFADDIRGYWKNGKDCSECAENYFGLQCNIICPGLSTGGLTCYGHGNCGQHTGGRCVCTGGYGNVSNCLDCDHAHYDESCTSACLGTALTGPLKGLPCSGHGACFSGKDGNGTCVCAAGWATKNCSVQCPGNGICSGNGTCSSGATGNGRCTCTDGRYAQPDCAWCSANFTGPGCNIDCLTLLSRSTNEICSGHGFCTPASNMFTAVCTCSLGYTGSLCDIGCGGTPSCSGHGHCDLQLVQCICVDNWDGLTCERCRPAFTGSTSCAIGCPVNPAGLVCSGRGTCYNGTCYCNRVVLSGTVDYCGVDCSLQTPYQPGQPSGCNYCTIGPDDGYIYNGLYQFGPTCSSLCSGTGPANAPVDGNFYTFTCSGHGYCDEGRNSTGLCACEAGYAGPDCAKRCPIFAGTGAMCTGLANGFCLYNETSGEAYCKCQPLFTGASCEIACPSFNGMACAGNGNCTAAGTCQCRLDWTGVLCNVPCLCSKAHGMCNTDICGSMPGYRLCTSCLCETNFTGLCYDCVEGTQGELCGGQCTNGRTVAQECQCFGNYSTPSCAVRCPADATGRICSGNGQCPWGNAAPGDCLCNANFYGPACSVRCTIELCSPLVNGQCNLLTGACECQDDDNGRWKMNPVTSVCDVCAVGFWGPSCSDPCVCNSHGSCDRNSGECVCYSDPINGFYGGTTCAACAVGYIGVSCQGSNILITKVLRNITDFLTGQLISAPVLYPPAIAGAPNAPSSPTTLTVEDRSGLLITGGSPLWLGNVTAADLAFLPHAPDQFLNFSCMRSGLCCPAARPDTAHSWHDQQFIYFLLQPFVSETCNLSIRIVRAPMLRGNITAWAFAEVLLDYTIDFVIDNLQCGFQPQRRLDLRIFHATAQSDRGHSAPDSRFGQTVPDNIVAFTVSVPRPDGNVSVEPQEGGFLVVINLRDVSSRNRNPSEVSLITQRQLSRNFSARDVAISTFVGSSQLQAVVVGGEDIVLGRWDIFNFTLDTNARTCLLGNALFAPTTQPSIRTLLPCWPNPKGDWTKCPDCLSARQLRFRGWGLLVAMATVSDTLMVWIQPMSDANGSSILAAVGGTCTSVRDLATVDVAARRFFIATAPADAGGAAYATAMAFDPLANVLYVALAVPGGVSQVVKCRTRRQSLSVLGVLKLGYISVNGSDTSIAEVVSKLAVSNSMRLLLGLITGIQRVRLATLLMYDVESIVPDIASFGANTQITVYGSGFGLLSALPLQGAARPVCDFGGGVIAPATIVSSTVLTCFAVGVSESSVDKCAGQQFEVSLYGSRWPTQNLLTLSRQPTAQLTSVDPPRWTFTSRTVTIYGSAFVATSFGVCRFYYCNGTTDCSYSDAVRSPVHAVSSSVITCVQPTVTSTNYNSLDVSFDGTQFSNVTLQYNIVGPPTNISVSQSAFVLSAENFTFFSFQVYTVDERRNQLRSLDQQAYEIYFTSTDLQQCNPRDYLWRFEGDGYPDPCRNVTLLNQSLLETQLVLGPWAAAVPQWAEPNRSALYRLLSQRSALGFRNVSLHGTAEFNSLMLYRPRVISNVALRLRAFETDWTALVTLSIVPGVPFALMINDITALATVVEISTTAGDVSPSINVYAVDQHGNKCDQMQPTAVSAFGYYVHDGSHCLTAANAALACFERREYRQEFLTIAAVASTIGVFTFTASLDYLHGVAHYIRFTSPGLKPVTTPLVRTKNCGPQLYKQANTTRCMPCPSAGAVCDGTERITVLPGFWRGADTRTVVYPCPLGTSVCIGSTAPVGARCAGNATGPLCSLCLPGYGHGSSGLCTPCQSTAATISVVVLIVLVFTIVLLVWSFVSLRTDRVTDFSVVFRTIVNHLQESGQMSKFSTQFQPLVRGLFQIQSGASSFSIDGFQAFECISAVAQSTASAMPPYVFLFASYMSLPVLAAIIALLQYGAVRIMGVVPLYSRGVVREIENDIEHFGEHCASAKWKATYPLFMVLTSTFNVCMFTLYQTLITQSTRVLQCEDFVIAQNGMTDVVQGYMKVDRGVTCNPNGSNIFTTPALLFGILYGFGIPMVFMLGYKLVNIRAGKPALTEFIFLFLCGGYKPQYWFWQAIIMVRKMFMVLVIVFLSDPSEGELQSYCGMWVMSASLVLQLWLQPAEKKEHNDVESLSLGILTLTLNLSLVYFWPGLPPWAGIFITVALFVFNVFALLVLLRFIYLPLVELASELLAEFRRVTRLVASKFTALTGKRDKRRIFKVNRSGGLRRGQGHDMEVDEQAYSANPKFFNPGTMLVDRDEMFMDFEELDAMTVQMQNLERQRARGEPV